MSLNTALAVQLLATGMLWSRPERGLAAILLQPNAAGTTIRRLLPILIVTPIVIGWFRLEAQRLGYLGVELGISVMVTASTLIIGAIAVWNAQTQGNVLRLEDVRHNDEVFLMKLGEFLRSSTASAGLMEASAVLLKVHLGASHCEFNIGERATRRSRDAQSVALAIAGATVRVPLEVGENDTAELIIQHPDSQFVPRGLAQEAGRRVWLWYLQLSANEARHESEEFLRVTLESMAEAVISTDEGGLIVTMNARAEELTGWSRQEAIGRLYREVVQIHADLDAGDGFNPDSPSAPSQALDTNSGTLTARDGTELPISLSMAPIRGANSEVLGTVLIVRDVTVERRSIQTFRLALEASPSGMMMVNAAGAIVLVNANVEALFGYSRAELLGSQVDLLVPQRFRGGHPSLRTGYSKTPEVRLMGAGRDLYGLHKDGREIPIEIGLNPVATARGPHILCSIADITERKRAFDQRMALATIQTTNEELEARVNARTAELRHNLDERELLLQEVHHRVKNNLQIISSLMNLQVRHVEDESAKSALRDCKGRIEAIAMVHERLYQSQDYVRVPFAEYAPSFVRAIFHAAGVGGGRIRSEMNVCAIDFPVATAINVGLILNELVTNATKHAFPDDQEGCVSVVLEKIPEGKVLLKVSDNGVGIPQARLEAAGGSLGMQLIEALVDQLEGELSIQTNSGTSFSVIFKAPPSPIP